MSVIYCDESGYTGMDLLSREQPFLVISSLLLSDEETVTMAEPLQAVTQASELKYSNLSRWPKSRSAMLDFAKRLDGVQSQIRFHLSNKRFALLGKVVDLLVEPVYHVQGIDFYADGRNVAYLNMFYVAALDAVEERDAMLGEFLGLCRRSTDEQWRRLADAVRALSAKSDALGELCRPLSTGVDLLRRYAPDSLDKADLAMMMTCVISLVRQWNQDLDAEVSIVADASNELFRSRDVLDILSEDSMPQVAEVSAGRIIGFPLRVTGLNLVDSRTHVGVQLADVAAGMINHVQLAIDDPRKRVGGYTDELTAIVTHWARMLQIIPEAKFTAEDLGRVGFDGRKILNATVEAFRQGGRSR